MPKLEDTLIDKLTPRPEVRENARALLRTVHSKTGPGTGHDIGEAKIGLPAICAYIASKSAGYADVSQDVAQKASCLKPRTFASTLRTIKAVLQVPKTPAGSPSKSRTEVDPTAYAALIKEHKIGQPLRVESWMKEAQSALVALPRYQRKFASLLADSGTEVRIAVFFWVCQTIKLSNITCEPLVDKHGVPPKTVSRLVKVLEEECIILRESIKCMIKEMRKKKASGDAPSKTPTTATTTPSHSRSASPTKSALRTASLTPSLAGTGSMKRKVAFSLSDISASEDDGVPETPSKRPRTTPRTMPVRKASSEEDVGMPENTRPRRLVASAPVAGPSTPRRPKGAATPTHAYRTPPSARMQALAIFSDDDDDDDADAGDAEDEMAVVDELAEVGQADDSLPLSRRFRPVFLDRAQWAQRAPRLARERAAAEMRTKALIERWGHPLEALRLAAVETAAG